MRSAPQVVAALAVLAGCALILAHSLEPDEPGISMTGGTHPTKWFKGGCHLFDGTFAYPRQMSSLMNSLTMGFLATGNGAYLSPLDSMAAHAHAYYNLTADERKEIRKDKSLEGTAGWASWRTVSQLKKALLKVESL